MASFLLLLMLLGVVQKLWRLRPILDAPIFVVPLVHVGVTLVVDIVQNAIAQHKVGGEVVDVSVVWIQFLAHLLDLLKAGLWQGVFQHHFVHRRAINVLFYNDFLINVKVQHFWHWYADLAKLLIVIELCLHLVAKVIVTAGLVMYLFDYNQFANILRQIGVATFAFAKQFY